MTGVAGWLWLVGSHAVGGSSSAFVSDSVSIFSVCLLMSYLGGSPGLAARLPDSAACPCGCLIVVQAVSVPMSAAMEPLAPVTATSKEWNRCTSGKKRARVAAGTPPCTLAAPLHAWARGQVALRVSPVVRNAGCGLRRAA